jgi:ribosomal protein S18 acetylase RimI-like enzyme
MDISIPTVQFREADKSDIPAIAQMRSKNWETEEYWIHRISGYMDCHLHPQQALMPRIIYIASEANIPVGFIAGHLTRRYECDGELEWIDVLQEYRRSGIASKLLQLLAAWFIEQKALKICVDVDPTNITARRFYKKHGAEDLNKHWLVWKDINNMLKAY